MSDGGGTFASAICPTVVISFSLISITFDAGDLFSVSVLLIEIFVVNVKIIFFVSL